MFLIQEQPKIPGDFKLFLPVAEKLLIINSDDEASTDNISLPEPLLEEKAKLQLLKGSQNIVGIELSGDDQYLAVTTESKRLLVFDGNFRPIKNIVLNRVTSKIRFSLTNDIIVADRTGDVYLYKIDEEQSAPTLLLGHLSVILDMVITKCGKYIITCDRDEKIRVSHFPNAYNIATYCLGHTEFVTSLKLLNCLDNVLLSASGDGTVRIWNYLEGKQIKIINTSNLVDEATLKGFIRKMDSENIEVTAIPITEIQTQESGTSITLALSLYSVYNLFLYKIDPNTLECSLLTTIHDVYSYCLLNRLYLLSGDNFKILTLKNDELKELKVHKKFQDKVAELKSEFSECIDVTLWYKRKFDNVQEYMERKKLRMESK